MGRDPEAYWTPKSSVFVERLRQRSGDAWPRLEARFLDALPALLDGVARLEMPGWIGRGVKPLR